MVTVRESSTRPAAGYRVGMLRMRLLGGAAVERDGAPLTLPPPATRLLAYLALHPGAHDRDALAGRFWPDAAGPAARANLRTALWALRRAVGEPALQASRATVGLDPAQVQLDVTEQTLLAQAGDPGAAGRLCAAALLAGWDADWVEQARRQQRSGLAGILRSLAETAETGGDPAGAAQWTRLRCGLDPLDEAAHAALVRQLAAAGDRAGALLAGRAVADRLRTELSVGPGPVLRAALAEARGGTAAAVANPFPAAARPMFGRADELRALGSAWAAARTGAGRLVLVTGEAGIGKTRLVGELARRADNAGARIAVGAAVDVGGQTPLALWQELVGQLSRTIPPPPQAVGWPAELGRLAPDVAARLGRGAPPPVASPELERLRLFDAVLHLVEWASSGRPVLLIGEDVHCADPASLQLAAYLGRRLAGLPVLLVLTRRDRPDRGDADALLADLAGRGVEAAEIELPPMAAAELAAVARGVAPLDDQTLETVIQAADGNPLLAVEAARAAAAGQPALAGGLRATVRAAIRGLHGPARDLLEALAVAGRTLSAAELTVLATADRDLAERGVMDTGLVGRAGAGLGFRHALLGEAVRADLGEHPRRYEQVALAIEAAAPSADHVAAEVAAHLRRAGRADLAGPRWQRAARHARSLGALLDAARFWTEAVRCAPDAADARLELAEVYGWLGQADDFEREWQAGLDLLPPPRRYLAWLRRGMVLRTVVCHPAGSLAAYRRATELLPSDAPAKVRTDALIGTAWGDASAGDPEHAAALLAELGPPAEDTSAAEIANVRLMTLIRQGRFADCERVADPGGAAAVRAGRPDLAYPIWIHAACALACAGKLDAALRAAEQAVAAVRGNAVIELPCLAARAFLLSRLGRHDEALTQADAMFELAERIDSPACPALARHDAGLIAAAAGRHAEAAKLLAAALERGAEVSRPAARLARAEALLGCGLPDEAAAEVRAATLEPVCAGDQPWALVPRLARLQGLIAQARGDHDQAHRRLTEAAEGWRRRLRYAPGEEFMANFVDLGRPPVAGLIEPARELARVESELAALDPPQELADA